ncbi:Acetyl xylan esterase (AXE1) [Neorhodopirellula lusitana]|uniref:Acetyl xylan esterase (AXE1) n=1 Tax=Neorhodopirellula lusitana TaxID=445327 RepID=A0ABY1PP92_9BACT|nr:NPCBM/NEW2 domain-containing protein [Neorhodopirellula lusitana]SMP38856.1 Acetyl xylan esterase (AXE1) [Neorhodopirellula lusitana]
MCNPLWIAILAALALSCRLNAESLPPLKGEKSPQTLDEVWAGYDPTIEPIETETLKEWEEDGTVVRAVRYCIGTFKGQKSWMGALYGFPKHGMELPALVQIHGGGGRASKQACIANAKRGYATISLNWRADDRYLSENDLPKSAQTDWGAVDGTQSAGSRGIEPNNDLRYDPVPSGRNGGYFLRTLAARRALTFLQRQAEVDGERLGVDGHSMGGVITLQTAAIDSRVKASAPSCAPPIDLEDTLSARTYAASAYAAKINSPMLFMSPSNDFHGHVEDMEWIMDRMPNQEFRIARSEHFNHKHNNSCLAAKELWFDAHLKGNYRYPARPAIDIDLNTEDGRPRVQITPDAAQPIDHVDVYFSRDARLSSYYGSKSRYWQFSKPVNEGDRYVASIDLFDLREPLWVFANIHYKLGEHQLTKPSTTMTSTTRMLMVDADELQAAGVKPDGVTTAVIEDFDDDWEREWIVSKNSFESFRLNNPRVPIPQYSKLVLSVEDTGPSSPDDLAGLVKGLVPDRSSTVFSNKPASLRVSLGDLAIGEYSADIKENDGTVSLYPFDLKHTKNGSALMNWADLPNPKISLKSVRGNLPMCSKLVWEPISVSDFMSNRPFQLGEVDKANGENTLAFDQADKIVGRIETDPQSFRVHESIVEANDVQGLRVHSPSEVTYFLKGKFSKFQATLVPGYQASVTFEVHGDDRLLFRSESFSGTSEPEEIEVDMSGVQKLKLIVTEGGNGWGGDWAMWANPVLDPQP